MENFSFKDEVLQKRYEKKVAELKALADEPVVDSDYLWDRTVRRYAIAMQRTKKVLSSEGIHDYITVGMMKNIDTFLNRCANPEFHIALVGAIKAGKSTLINALLGYEYASTKVTPETASLTKFRKADGNLIKVSFYTKEEWGKLWKSAQDAKATVFLDEYKVLGAESEKNKWLSHSQQKIVCSEKRKLVDEIMKWTSSKSPVHYFVKEVEVGLEEFPFPEGVVLVDTPGLDDVVEYRSDITRDYIDRANAVLVCVKSDALTGQEMHTIYSVFANTRYHPEKVYIIATQLDTLNRPEKSWIEQREEWLKHLKGKGAYGSFQLAEANLIPVSAYLYTLLVEYETFANDDDKYWELDSILSKLRIRMEDFHVKYQNLMEFTNIRLLQNKIDKEIVSRHKEIMIEDIQNSYSICKEEIQECLKKIRNEQEDIIKTCKGGIEEISKKQKEFTRKYEEAKNDKKELETLINKLRIITQKRADELEQSIRTLGR